MSHNARVLCLESNDEIVSEMKKIHAEDIGIEHMLPKSEHYLVKLEGIRCPIAHILKEAFLSNGGDAVIARGVITATVSNTDAILIGTYKQYKNVISSLKEQQFGSEALACEIENAISNFDSLPRLPDIKSIENDKIRGMYQKIGQKTLVMGILNVTPDSFSDGGKYNNLPEAIKHAQELIEAGADIIDIGGETTKPGCDPLSVEEEIKRIVPLISELADKIDVPISVDTYKAAAAEAALDNGALIINDISAASFDSDMPQLIAQRHCPTVIMHIKGTPKSMQVNPIYEDLIGEVYSFLNERIKALADAGADEKMLIIDPGFGFGKTAENNLELIRRLKEFKSLGLPILMGTSRKSTIGKILGDVPPTARIFGTAATVALSVANGANIVRVHDVKEMSQVCKIADAIIG